MVFLVSSFPSVSVSTATFVAMQHYLMRNSKYCVLFIRTKRHSYFNITIFEKFINGNRTMRNKKKQHTICIKGKSFTEFSRMSNTIDKPYLSPYSYSILCFEDQHFYPWTTFPLWLIVLFRELDSPWKSFLSDLRFA